MAGINKAGGAGGGQAPKPKSAPKKAQNNKPSGGAKPNNNTKNSSNSKPQSSKPQNTTNAGKSQASKAPQGTPKNSSPSSGSSGQPQGKQGDFLSISNEAKDKDWGKGGNVGSIKNLLGGLKNGLTKGLSSAAQPVKNAMDKLSGNSKATEKNSPENKQPENKTEPKKENPAAQQQAAQQPQAKPEQKPAQQSQQPQAKPEQKAENKAPEVKKEEAKKSEPEKKENKNEAVADKKPEPKAGQKAESKPENKSENMDGNKQYQAMERRSPDDVYRKKYGEPYKDQNGSTLFPASQLTDSEKDWKKGRDGEGIGVAVIDTGAAAHPDFADRVVDFQDLVNGNSGVDNMYDDNGHGTATAGIIAGDGTESDGEIAGVAPKANLQIIKALDETGHGDSQTIADGIQYAVDTKDDFNTKVINMSLGAPGMDDPIVQDAIRNATDSGISVVAAAGNFGQQYNSFNGMARDTDAVTVGSTYHNGTLDSSDDTLSRFSSEGYNSMTGQYEAPDIYAPGQRVSSTGKEGNYVAVDGTSFSAPMVSGEMAKLYQRNPDMDTSDAKSKIIDKMG